MILKKIEQIVFFCGGLRHPAPPTGAAPLDPACFWIEDSSRNRFALNGIQELPASGFFCFSTITRKNKNRKNLNLIILSIQPIADLSCKFDHFEKKIDFDIVALHQNKK